MIYSALGLRLLYSWHDPLTLLTAVNSYSIMSDRFNALNHYSPWNLGADPEIPKPKYEFKYTDIGEILDLVVSRIKDKPITLMWSGGVDSTALLVSCLKNGVSDLQVVSSLHGIHENRGMVNYLIKNKIKLDFPESPSFKTKEFKDRLIINGWCADQLFGFAYAATLHPESYYEPYRDCLPNILSSKLPRLTNQDFEALFEAIDQYSLRVLGHKITLFSELSLLENFGLKFTHVWNNMRLNCDNPSMIYNIYCPYADPLIQDWAIMNFDYNSQARQFTDSTKYKLPLKQYIYKFNKDDQYLMQKSKTFSWRVSQFSGLSSHKFRIKTDKGYFSYNFPFDKVVFDIRKNPILLDILKNEIKPNVNLNMEFI